MAENEPQEEPTLKILTSVPTRAEAGMVIGDLEASGIYAMQRPDTRPLGLGACDIYVREHDFDRAREVLNEPISEDELIQAEEEAARDDGYAPQSG
jgi:hypothetical protein